MAAALTGRSDGSLSARGTARKLKASLGNTKNNDFLKLVERTEDAFVTQDDSAVQDVRRILADVRSQFDSVHSEAEKKETELQKLREEIRVHDLSHGNRTQEVNKDDDIRTSLEKEHTMTVAAIHDAETSQKVYEHMLSRSSKEQAILKQKMLVMESHLNRKQLEEHRKISEQERLIRKCAQSSAELEVMEQEVKHERVVREAAYDGMKSALQGKQNARERRARFEEWRHKVALDAANEAFNAAAGRLRKLYAVEKMSGNCLQKITYEQVERSQATEDGFQKIREVTGLNDVMDIVHKFLNRETEHEQLKMSVKDAELRLETLREQFETFKSDTDGLAFDPDAATRSRALYLEVEENEEELNQVFKDHEGSRARLQKTMLQTEHIKRWAARVGKSLATFEETVERPADLPNFFQQMHRAVDKFVAHIAQQISTGKVQRKNMSQAASKEYHEASRLLTDKDFLKTNCRVPASADDSNTAAKAGLSGHADEELTDAAQQAADREKMKAEAERIQQKADRKAGSQQKKRSVAPGK